MINKFIETFEWKWGHVIEFVAKFLRSHAKQKIIWKCVLQQDFSGIYSIRWKK